MSKDEKKTGAPGREATPYKLHTEAVESLVTANTDNTPRYSKEELEKYRSGKLKWRLPDWLKVLGIKFWFYGAICFFVFMGLGMLVADQLDLFFIAAIITGMVIDLLMNHFLRFTEKLPGGNAKWMMVTRRGAAGFLMNLMYGFLLIFLVVTAYQLVNTLLYTFTGSGDALLRVEPIGYGLLSTGADYLCVGCKNMLRKIVADAKQK